MKIQTISNQPAFDGKIIYAKRVNGENALKSLKVSERAKINLPKGLAKIENQISELIKEKPYDLFFFRNEEQNEFIQIEANKNLRNILGRNFSKQSEIKFLVHENMSSDIFLDASESAIKEYETVMNKQPKHGKIMTYIQNIIGYLA